MARTTLVIEDNLFRRIKKRASEEDRTFQDVANDLLRRGLSSPERPYRLQWRGWKTRLRPGVNILDRDSLFDIMDGR